MGKVRFIDIFYFHLVFDTVPANYLSVFVSNKPFRLTLATGGHPIPLTLQHVIYFPRHTSSHSSHVVGFSVWCINFCVDTKYELVKYRGSLKKNGFFLTYVSNQINSTLTNFERLYPLEGPNGQMICLKEEKGLCNN